MAFNFLYVCDAISSAISSQSQVFYFGSDSYLRDIDHWASSSTQLAACTVEPGTAEDVGKILQILGKYRTPFGVKSGGHTANPKFSSSAGVLIAMYRFKEVTYDQASQTANIGTGLIFDDVYSALAPYGVSVLGGRVTGIGVGGFVLGGGYSWKSNQYGLALDTVTAFELVKPDGEIVSVTESTEAELFFGLKGGYNNFGIVTRIQMRTFPQSSIWGGTITYFSLFIPQVSAAVTKFSTSNTDPKANIIATYMCIATEPLVSLMLYYDAPNPPKDIFRDFLILPPLSSDVGTRSISDFIQKSNSNSTANLRGIFHTVPLLQYSQNLVQVIENEAILSCSQLLSKTDAGVSYSIEPFLSSILSHNTSLSAYPPTREKTYLPLNIYFAWLLSSFDRDNFDAVKQSATRIRDVAVAEGQDLSNAPLYPNYAIFDTPLSQMYGGNVEKLNALKKRVDPSNVMGLAGGFKF
ncbi:hypothetical protein M378DRAFT_85489 [Amanita muscaria Koide BX008]|uniref:FAD-binding PCMH-type domain-containing protein n=1 Tax=Amanita muscaria (strain Koide BX008) TaxID=946122 RepID=A0A0C2WQW0_AMAMK|nr:hypothetical protein M378DRAFT_85489 [Amanita muscaria Koide BX008]